jgi:hypothetical protein
VTPPVTGLTTWVVALGLAAACGSTPILQTTSSSPVGSTAFASPSPTPTPSAPTIAFPTCLEPNPNATILDALGRVPGYAYSVAGFVYVPDVISDPDSPPRTRRAATSSEGAFVAPDRVWTRSIRAASDQEPAESIAIGTDLWVKEAANRPQWEHLPGAVEPTTANELAAIIRDAGPGWEGLTGPADLPGEGCLLRIRAPVTSGGKGYREVAVRADRTTGLPSVLRIVVKDALDRYGYRHDTNLLYRIRYDRVPPIEAPGQVSPSP